MLLFVVFTICVGDFSTSFLQQEESSVNITQAGQADYDLFTYLEMKDAEAPPYALENFYPQGESSPDNDYLLVQYQQEIDYIYNVTYLAQQNTTSTLNTISH